MFGGTKGRVLQEQPLREEWESCETNRSAISAGAAGKSWRKPLPMESSCRCRPWAGAAVHEEEPKMEHVIYQELWSLGLLAGAVLFWRTAPCGMVPRWTTGGVQGGWSRRDKVLWTLLCCSKKSEGGVGSKAHLSGEKEKVLLVLTLTVLPLFLTCSKLTFPIPFGLRWKLVSNPPVLISSQELLHLYLSFCPAEGEEWESVAGCWPRSTHCTYSFYKLPTMPSRALQFFSFQI